MSGNDRETLVQTGVISVTNKHRTILRPCVCRVISGPDTGREIALGPRPLVVGAGSDCGLVLTDPKASRRHAELSLQSGGVMTRDLDSTNGIFNRKSRITQAVLPPGSSIEIGETTLRFVEAKGPPVPPSRRQRFGGFVGESLMIREVFALLELASPTDATVVLQGESGTGKEVAARAIADHSKRAAGPFKIVDCSAAKEQLIESDFFGHIKGAFTGAVVDRKGAFVEAHGGTLFLDEIGELPLASQAKLLRALEARTVCPLGSDRSIDVDVRIIAATNRDLEAMVAEETFRFDLFHRLAVVNILLPPLRDRPEDLPSLIRNFYEGRGVEPGEITGPNLARLTEHEWPGNVRELRNVLERASVLSGKPDASFAELKLWLEPSIRSHEEAAVDTHQPFKDSKERWIETFEKRYISALYERHDHNITHASEEAGINRRHFRLLLHKHGLAEHE